MAHVWVRLFRKQDRVLKELDELAPVIAHVRHLLLLPPPSRLRR